MKKISILFVLVFCAAIAYSQKNLQAAYIVNNNNDTIHGFINYKEWFRNPTDVSFSESKETSAKKYSIHDIQSFSISGKELYRRYIVKISMGKDLINEMTFRDTTSRTDTVFLKVLHEGKFAQLFSYTDEVKSRLFISSADNTTPVELKNTEYITEGQVTSEKEYRDTLLALAKKYAPANSDLQAKIYAAGFYKDDILDILFTLNGINKTNEQTETKREKASIVRFFAGLGLNKARIKMEGDNRYINKTSSGTVAPLFAAGFDILLNPYIGRLFLRTEFSYSSAKTDAYAYKEYFASKENYYLKLKQNNLAIYEMINFNLYNGKNFKYFIGAGAGFNFSSYPQNQETFIREASTDTTTNVNNDYIAYIKKFWLNGIIRTGVTIRNLDLAVAYTTNGNISNYVSYGANVSSFRLQVNYIFHK